MAHPVYSTAAILLVEVDPTKGVTTITILPNQSDPTLYDANGADEATLAECVRLLDYSWSPLADLPDSILWEG